MHSYKADELRATMKQRSGGSYGLLVKSILCTLLSMPVTACSAERNWSKWRATFVLHRNALGIETAQDVIFLQQNDPATCTHSQRSTDMYVEWVARQGMLRSLGSGRACTMLNASTLGQPRVIVILAVCVPTAAQGRSYFSNFHLSYN
jgi:hypothetical protein